MLLLALLPPLAGAAEAPGVALHGDVKLFFLAGDSRPWFGFSDASVATLGAMGLTEEDALDAFGLAADPFAQGVASGRLKGTVQVGVVRFDTHWAIAAQTAGRASVVPGFGTGVGLDAPELVPLAWSPDTGPGLSIQHRIDRMVLSAKLPNVDMAAGRQPVSFGVGRFFTPLDLVNPFHPATIDAEYKPGVDALRVDAYAGVAGRLTLVGAWAGDPVVGEHRRSPEQPVVDDLVLAAAGQATVGVTDLLGFVGGVHGEPVLGAGTTSGIGPVGVHGEASLTVPAREAPFVRAVVGADGRATPTTSLAGELYLQTSGAVDPADYLDALDDPRFQRGEIWQMGQLYGAASVAQELSPLVYTTLSVISNLRDPSALVAVGGSWSVADDADVVFGGYFGVGAPPDRVDVALALDPVTFTPSVTVPDAATLSGSVNSEFGLYPAMGYVQVRACF